VRSTGHRCGSPGYIPRRAEASGVFGGRRRVPTQRRRSAGTKKTRGRHMNAHSPRRARARVCIARSVHPSLEIARSAVGRPRFSACALAVAAGLVGGTVLAQQPGAIEEVTVTGSRIATSGVNTPTPVTAVTAEELRTMEPGTLVDALKQLPQFYNTITTQQAVGGSVASGGSNVNLRGAGAERTLVLLEGRRLGPANKFGTVDIGIIP